MKIAFTSCMDASRVPHQPVWLEILSREPDALLLLGDQIYMDWGDLGRSHWKKLIERDRAKGLEAFAKDMHMRYEAQAGVKEFRELAEYFTQDGKQLLMTWDDHDFAWNNSVGAGPDDEERRVPAEVKNISRALFLQFRGWLKAPTDKYPELSKAIPNVLAPPPGDEGIEEFDVLAKDAVKVPYALLDTRWYRTSRSLPGPDCTMLGHPRPDGTDQRSRLRAELAKPEGLLIVAAGAPLKYRYLLSDQDWESAGEGTYPEYAELLQEAQRPVLFLGGDVHRNSWGGRVSLPGGRRSEVLQVLSSGAAIANIGPKKFPASFGWLEIPPASGKADSVAGGLVARDADGHWTDTPVPELNYTAREWLGELDGEAGAGKPALASGVIVDPLPLSVFTLRNRAHGHPAEDPVSVPLDSLSDLDAIYAPGPVKQEGQFPEPISVSVQPDKLTCHFVGDPGHGSKRMEEVTALMRHTFDTALVAKRRSVALFIHGLAKSPSAAIDQGYGFRAAFKDCEPAVFSWPTGGGDGLLGAYFGYYNAIEAARRQQVGLGAVIAAFGAMAKLQEYKDLTKVIVARSIGSVALGEYFTGARGSNVNGLLAGVHRIVLSAPVIKIEDFVRKGGSTPSFDGVGRPIFVTVNQHDQSLQIAKWINGFDRVLGFADPRETPRLDGATYLDFTHSAGVGRLHDYLLPKISKQQIAVNEALIYDKDFQTGELETGGALAHAAEGSPIWSVMGRQ
jgi:hypothetical protein